MHTIHPILVVRSEVQRAHEAFSILRSVIHFGELKEKYRFLSTKVAHQLLIMRLDAGRVRDSITYQRIGHSCHESYVLAQMLQCPTQI